MKIEVKTLKASFKILRMKNEGDFDKSTQIYNQKIVNI